MTSVASPKVYTIPSGVAFVDALAKGLLAQTGGDPAALAEMRILLPTRRACRVMTEAFLRHSSGRALLLPRISPIGDVDESDLGLDMSADDDIGIDPSLPPAIHPLRRQFLLMRLLLAGPQREMSPDQAARLAAELGRLLDQAIIEGVDLSSLGDLVTDRFAGHWQTVIDFLSILTTHWPEILRGEGCIDASDHRSRLLQAQGDAWASSSPRTPVIAAGSTGSIPATAALLAVVSRLPQGAVILPGLDRDADESAWRNIGPTHPQYTMARLIDLIGIDRQAVEIWPAASSDETPPSRAELVNLALRPATADARTDVSIPAEALQGVTRIDAPGPAEEARAIALIMRETLETPERTAALVTPDRGLARRVAADLQRWSIAVDDSAGEPLSVSPAFVFLRLVVRMVAEDFAPVPLLAALKHPLALGGMGPGEFRRQVRTLERVCLRGLPPQPGIEGLRRALDSWIEDAKERAGSPGEVEVNAGRASDIRRVIDTIDHVTAPLSSIGPHLRLEIPDIVERHLAVAEALAASDDRDGAERLWSGDSGDAAAAFVADVAEHAGGPGLDRLNEYADLFDALAAGRAVRPRFGRHPRLFIWGPLEARLQHADVTILGGLNEETWPPRVSAGPWMSRPMMETCGLPLPERRIGLSAHDFVQAFCAPRVFLTRPCRAEGAPTVASRWLLRLESALAADPAGPRLNWGAEWLGWQTALDAPNRVEPSPRPAPKPPVELRPRRLTVTEVETWMRDPYAVYARHILKLRRLDPLDMEPGPAEFGDFVHRAIHAFLSEGQPTTADALDRLLAAGRLCVGRDFQNPEARAFWWPRFERLAAWLVKQEAARGDEIVTIVPEVIGQMQVPLEERPFTLVARADRIELRQDGTRVVVDYKTGAPPSPKQVVAGFSPQLPLEAAIVERGGFATVAAGPIAALEYWQIGGGREPGKCSSAGSDPKALADDAFEGLTSLVTRFDLEDTAYEARPRSAFAPPYSDYEHLERVREWAAVGDEDAN